MNQRPTTTRRGGRSIRALLGAVLISILSVTTALAGSSVSSLVEVESTTGDMGSGALEWSGAAYNPENRVVMTVDDEHNAYEIPVTAHGWLNASAPVRVLDLQISASDYEGVAWLTGNTYAFLSEGTGRVYITDVSPTNSTVRNNDVQWSFDTLIDAGADGNSGAEGLAVDAAGYFYVTDEKPASVSRYSPAGAKLGTIMTPQLSDASAVEIAVDGSMLVVSHESRKVVHYEADWDAETATVIGERSLSSFTQAEGIAIINNNELHVYGEMKSGGTTFAHFSGEIFTPDVMPADVNCSGDYDLLDALRIAQIQVGTAQPMAECGSGDVNTDGQTDLLDALFISQCQVGLPNVLCPANN